jgi:hypothetical protein
LSSEDTLPEKEGVWATSIGSFSDATGDQVSSVLGVVGEIDGDLGACGTYSRRGNTGLSDSGLKI